MTVMNYAEKEFIPRPITCHLRKKGGVDESHGNQIKRFLSKSSKTFCK